MDSTLRTTKGLEEKINSLQSNLLKRYSNLVGLAAVKKPDRTAAAVTQYQIQTETAALIRAAEEVQILIRQMQEMWLFGQLKTLDHHHQAQKQAEENEGAVKELLGILHSARQSGEGDGNEGSMKMESL